MTNNPVATRGAEVRFPLQNVMSREIEGLVRFWGEKSLLRGEVLSHLILAVNKTVAAIAISSKEHDVRGDLVIKTFPYTRWLTVELTFPQTIPLAPTFENPDDHLTEVGEMARHPEILWRSIITKMVDKAVWEETGGKKTIRLTQYARRRGHPSELYFLNLTPSPKRDLKLRFLSDGSAVMIAPDSTGTLRLSQEAAFAFQAVDGITTVREIYFAFIEKFGLVNPGTISRIIEDLALRGLITTGHPLIEENPGFWGTLKLKTERVLAFQCHIPNPDAFLYSMNRFIGWLWSAPMALVYAGFIIFSIWYFDFDLAPHGHIFVRLHNTPELWTLWAFLGLFLGFAVVIAIHEISHAMVCKRLGGAISVFGIMLYFGGFAAYCDTSDAWRFPNKWHRIGVSFAGPFSTLIMGCLFGWGNYFLTKYGNPTLGVFFGALAFLCMLCVVINLMPFLELDGYYIYADLLNIPHLKKKSFSYLKAVAKKITGGAELPPLPMREKVVFLFYGLGSPLLGLLLIALPIYELLSGNFSQAPRLLVWLAVFLILLFLFQQMFLAGTTWYQHRHMIIDLKQDI